MWLVLWQATNFVTSFVMGPKNACFVGQLVMWYTVAIFKKIIVPWQAKWGQVLVLVISVDDRKFLGIHAHTVRSTVTEREAREGILWDIDGEVEKAQPPSIYYIYMYIYNIYICYIHVVARWSIVIVINMSYMLTRALRINDTGTMVLTLGIERRLECSRILD